MFPLTRTLTVCFVLATAPPTIDFSAGKMTVEIYEAGQLVGAASVPLEGPLRNRLNAVVSDKGRKWQPSFVTFAPRIKIRAGTDSVNLQPERAIVNYTDSHGRLIQAVTPI